MESALYGIFTRVGEVSEISLVRCAHSFDFRYFTNSCENPVRARFSWQQRFDTNLLQKSFNEFFNRHGLIVVKYAWCNPAGDEISNPGLSSNIVSLHYLFIT